MVDNVINGLIAGVVGAVAFAAVRALVNSNIYDGLTGGYHNLPYAAANATAGDLMIHDILPLAIAIMVIAGLFMGLTHVRGV